MVARINSSRNLSRVLSYNEKKVAQNQAQLLAARNYLQEKNRLTSAEKFHRLQNLNELNPRSKVNTLHISLNFQPGEKFTDPQMTDIADRYMQGLRLDHQPYLVYRHDDADHPHLHIVTSLIQSDGRRVDTNQLARRRSEPTRKAIEAEFNLVPARGQKQSVPQAPEEMRRAIETINRDYRFTNLDEYNALLRQHRVYADPGEYGSLTRRHGGLLYRTLDDQGNKVGPAIKASTLPTQPTLRRLDQKFADSRQQRTADENVVRQKIDWARTQNPSDPNGLLIDLRDAAIDVMLHQRDGRQTLVYIDHDRKTAVSGDALGEPYQVNQLFPSLAPRQQQDQRRQPGEQQRTDRAADRPAPDQQLPGFNPQTPQLVSLLLSPDKPAGTSFDFEQDQDLRHRRRLH